MLMAMMHLVNKVEAGSRMVLVGSEAFQIYLKIFLEIWVEGKVDKENKEGKTLSTK